MAGVQGSSAWPACGVALHGGGSDGVRQLGNVVVRPVNAREKRRVDESDPLLNVATIENQATGVVTAVLPAEVDPGVWPQLTIGLDSGSIGRAGASFAKNALSVNRVPGVRQNPQTAARHNIGP